MAMKKIHLNSPNQLILGFLFWSRGRTAEHAVCLLCINSLILGPNFQACSKSLCFSLYIGHLVFWVDVGWSGPVGWSGDGFGVLGRDFLQYWLWNIINDKKSLKWQDVKNLKIAINKIFPLNLKQTYLWLPKCTSMVELHHQCVFGAT